MIAASQLTNELKTSKTFKKRAFCFRLICCSLFLLPCWLQAAIIYVNPTAAGANNGSSWNNAFTNLSSALVVAKSGDEIWVKKGVYKPVTKVDFNSNGITEARETTFEIPNGVAVYGGFAGLEISREQRDVKQNVTVLSGDIDNNDFNLDANSIAESTGNVIGDNAYHVIFTSNVNAATIVDGFVITAGKALSVDPITDANQDGGGWYNKLSSPGNASSPTIKNSVFQGNYAASEGGAIYNTNAGLGGAVLSLILNCKFIANKSNVTGGAITLGSFKAGNYKPAIQGCEFVSNEARLRGGAMYLVGDHAKVDSSFFTNNKVTVVSMNGLTLAGAGGAIEMVGSNADFSRCIFKGNSATGVPTGPYEGGGGGALHITINLEQDTALGKSEPKFTACGFYSNNSGGNTLSYGGAVVHLCDGGRLRPKYINCVFSANQAQNDGGAMANYTRVLKDIPGYVPEFTLNVTNCTFVKNHAGKKGGGIYTEGYTWKNKQVANSRIENSIIWDNSAGTSGPEVSFDGNNVVASSLIKSSGGSGGNWKQGFGTDGGNNLDLNPGFININDADGGDNLPATGDDGLKVNSYAPTVNKGNNAAIGLAGITKDYASAARVNGGKIDMGAYERGGFTFPGSKTSWLTATENADLSVFPVPAHSQFNIVQRIPTSENCTLKIYSSLGQLSRQENVSVTNGRATVEVKNLVPGNYVIQLISASGQTMSKKIIIE